MKAGCERSLKRLKKRQAPFGAFDLIALLGAE